MKQCGLCKNSKPLSDFYKQTRSKDGLQHRCIDCCRKQNKSYYRSPLGQAYWDCKNARESGTYPALIEMYEDMEAYRQQVSSEKAALRQRRWEASNRERINDNKRRRYKTDPEAVLRHTRKYNALKRGASGANGMPNRDSIVAWYGNKCLYPDCKTVTALELDHVIPVSKGGKHSVENIQILCKYHNVQKGNRSDTDYRKQVLWLLI